MPQRFEINFTNENWLKGKDSRLPLIERKVAVALMEKAVCSEDKLRRAEVKIGEIET